MSKVQDLTDNAFTTFNTLREQIDGIIAEINNNDFGDSGSDAIGALDEVNMKLLKAYMALEDAYGDIEDLEIAP